MSEKKKSRKKPTVEKLLLATAMIQLIQALIDLIGKLTE